MLESNYEKTYTEDVGTTYYISDEELQETMTSIFNMSKELDKSVHDAFSMIKIFTNISSRLLSGDTWKYVESNFQSYENRLTFAEKLNERIIEANNKYITVLTGFLGTDKELNTADLSIFKSEKQSIENEIQFLNDENTELSLTPEMIQECVGYNQEGMPIYDLVKNKAYDANQTQIIENTARIKDILIPALIEFARLTAKIDEFNYDVLPVLNRMLDDIKQDVDKYLDVINEIQSISIE